MILFWSLEEHVLKLGTGSTDLLALAGYSRHGGNSETVARLQIRSYKYGSANLPTMKLQKSLEVFCRIIDHRMAWFGRVLEAHSVSTPLPCWLLSTGSSCPGLHSTWAWIQHHRTVESQNPRGWKGPLDIIKSNSLLKQFLIVDCTVGIVQCV